MLGWGLNWWEEEEGRNVPLDLWKAGHNYSAAPSGTCQKSRNRITNASFHQALLPETAETAAWLLHHTTPQSSSRSWKVQGKHQSCVVCEEWWGSPWFSSAWPTGALRNCLLFPPQVSLAKCWLMHFFPFFFLYTEDFGRWEIEEAKTFV